MTQLRLAVLTAAVLSTAASMSWGQNYQFEVETETFNDVHHVELPEEIEFSPIGSFERTEIEFAGQEAAYGDNYWGQVEIYTLDRALTGRLVFYYDPHGIAEMKQRVVEADVINENDLFPITLAEFIAQCGRRCWTSDDPAIASPRGLIVKTAQQPTGRSRYDEMTPIAQAKSKSGFIVVNYADSELLGMAP